MITYRVTASALELRYGPGTNYAIKAQLPHDSLVTATGGADAEGWIGVDAAQGGSGWVAVRYLAPVQSAAPPAAPPAATAPPHAAAPSAVPAAEPSTAPVATGPETAANALVFDISHFNGKVDFAAAYAAGQRGVIHKATEGTGYVDPMFHANLAAATAAGLLFGAYHFGTGDDPVAQAEHFLGTTAADGRTLLVLDWEPNPQGAAMTLAQARAFVSHVQQRTGRWPGLYSGSTAREALGGHTDPVLGNCWLWLAEYGDSPEVPPAWRGWTLWQYTDGSHGPGPYEINGVGRCDRDRFAGDGAALTAFWSGLKS
jgi:lysozyme